MSRRWRAAGFPLAATLLAMLAPVPHGARLQADQNTPATPSPVTFANDVAPIMDAVTVDTNVLESLPMFDQDYIATLSRFLDARSIGTGGVTVVVNDMEVSALNVSASAVAQIRTNQDPYSAEYSRPGHGRIEILTKRGSQDHHGEANLIFRDALFNARNAFASTTPANRRRIFE